MINYDLKNIYITEKEERIQFLCNVVRKRYRFVEDKSVPEEDMLREITLEYWKTKKKLSEQEIQPSLIECIQKLFPKAKRKKVKKKSKKVYPFHLDSYPGFPKEKIGF